MQTDNAAIASTVLDKLIQTATDDSNPQNRVAPPLKPNLVRKSSGWGDRYREPISLTGDEWSKTLLLAAPYIEAGGVVALLGDRGTGKTQMAAEIARSGKWAMDEPVFRDEKNNYSQTAIYRRAMNIFLELRAANGNKSTTSELDVLRKLTNCGLLVMDEFQERGESDWENRMVTHLIDVRYSERRPTILISNHANAKELAQCLSDSVISRIRENGKSFVCNWPSYRDKQ